jgi:hypothetical protein
MRDVIRVPECTEKEPECKPIEFTHYKGINGWIKSSSLRYKPMELDRVVYLGKCDEDGDMFASYYGGFISIYKGHLNSGKY